MFAATLTTITGRLITRWYLQLKELNATTSTLALFVVEKGRAGAQKFV